MSKEVLSTKIRNINTTCASPLPSDLPQSLNWKNKLRFHHQHPMSYQAHRLNLMIMTELEWCVHFQHVSINPTLERVHWLDYVDLVEGVGVGGGGGVGHKVGFSLLLVWSILHYIYSQHTIFLIHPYLYVGVGG